MSVREKFVNNGIPYDDIDSEMIEILDVLNFGLGVKTKFSCIGHSPEETTYIMFDEDVSEEKIFMLLSIVDGNVGTANVKQTKLYKWARMSYQEYFKLPYYPSVNWILEIKGTEDVSERLERLNKIAEELKRLYCFDESKVG